MKYTYDDYDRMTGVKYDSETTDRYTYEYDASGNAVLVRDNNLGRVLQTEHDLTDRPMGTQLRSADGSLIYRTELDYDNQNRLVGFGEEAEGSTYKTSYTYDNDNRVTEIGFGGNNKVKYTYDNLGRVATRVVENGTDAGKLTSTYTFVSGGHGTGSTTPLVARISQPKISFEYTYDNRGNIISEKRGTLTTTYTYDALGQLVRVNDPLEYATWVYEYDRGGNITSKKKYVYTTGTLGTVQQTIPYVYSDSTWKDKLTSYNGQAISYDAIGNPLSDGTWTYTWQAGRQLKKMTKSGVTVEFKYDHNGLRTQKKVTQNGVITTTNYTLHGKLVTHMTVGSDKLHFFYDAQSRPTKVNFNGTVYTYLHNLQGDIVGILDSNGTLVVEYSYDAWGKPLATIGTYATTLGKLNPFRYRGYIYDEETGMYWLQNRYYCPEWHKFIIADLKIGSRGRINSYNAYNYCYANPVKCMDPSGFDAIDVNGSCGGFCYPRVRANFVTWRQVPSYMRKKALASVSTFNRKVNKTRDAFEKYTSISGSVGYGIGGSICAGKFVDVSLHLFKATVGMEYNDSYFSHSEKRIMPYELKYGSNLVLLEGSYSVLFFDMFSGYAYKTYIEHTECGDGTVSVREYDSVRDGKSFDESNIGNFNLGVSGYLGIGGEISLNVDRALVAAIDDIWF